MNATSTLPYYQRWIAQDLARVKRADVEPRLIEAWMRLEHDVLSSMDTRTFRREVKIALACVDADKAASERLAESFGL